MNPIFANILVLLVASFSIVSNACYAQTAPQLVRYQHQEDPSMIITVKFDSSGKADSIYPGNQSDRSRKIDAGGNFDDGGIQSSPKKIEFYDNKETADVTGSAGATGAIKLGLYKRLAPTAYDECVKNAERTAALITDESKRVAILADLLKACVSLRGLSASSTGFDPVYDLGLDYQNY